ncbi:MAG: hypothetical protein HY912_06055 [Desulfomonile tiedjei]|uniref:Secreted protein n=1 Tax=Desulfomonile tiedjei TaxID=2358 RepID=A0A9D6V1R5_9BACT|nr:hypothetical protein [Desulfomonile tiedjei]
MNPARALPILTMMLLALLAIECGADGETERTADSLPVSSDKAVMNRQYPIEAPPASEILPRLKKLAKTRPHAESDGSDVESQKVQILRQLMGRGPQIALPESQCFRSIPTRDEFLRMVRKHPADANQILRRCNIDVRSISPIPQLPVGLRQLPEDTRQRPVGTWYNY